MKRVIVLSLASAALSKLLEENKISYSQYVQCFDDIKETLDISDEEYLDFINKKW